MSSSVQVQRCFTSTETIRTIRDGEPRMATSTFHTAPELCGAEFRLTGCLQGIEVVVPTVVACAQRLVDFISVKYMCVCVRVCA